MIYSTFLREDLYRLAHVAGREPYDLHHLTHVSRVSHIFPGFITSSHLMIYSTSLREYLYGLVHVAGREPYDLHHLTHVSWVGSELCSMHIVHNLAQNGSYRIYYR